ncbi:hypothetical protein [Helicobacter suis]|uniref:hypothetical protein n=1 Tax=Helicobacter suis TaxID=104628 RepID=UPI0013D1A1E8|nr:hypothetical protein [Helicobacter suis]
MQEYSDLVGSFGAEQRALLENMNDALGQRINEDFLDPIATQLNQLADAQEMALEACKKAQALLEIARAIAYAD